MPHAMYPVERMQRCSDSRVRFVNPKTCYSTGDMGLAVSYKAPVRPKMVALSVPFRVFQHYFSRHVERSEDGVSYAQFIAGLKQHPDAADSLGLMSAIKQSNASLQIFQLLFGVEPYDEEKQVTLKDLFRTFSGQEIEDLGLDEPYEKDEGPVRPDFISAKVAISAFYKIVPMSRAYVTHGELIDGMKKDAELATTLGFQKPIKDENGTHVIYQIM